MLRAGVVKAGMGSAINQGARMTRVHCLLFGCRLDDHVPECVDCGAQLYYPEFRDDGPISRLLWWMRDQRARLFRRCAHCNKPIWFKPEDLCCSEKCESEWVPF